MRESILKAARQRGFAAAYFLAPLPLPLWRERASLSRTQCGMGWDVPAAYPKAKCVVLLVKAYTPYQRADDIQPCIRTAPGTDHILPYYIAEHEAYFEAKALCGEIAAQGFYCEPARVPARALALGNGVGAHSKNGLLAISDFGTRAALFNLATDACEPLPGAGMHPACPDGCDACIRSCPTGAIAADGLDATKCLRYFMDSSAHPAFVLEKLTSLLGCDLCQRVCPKNARLKPEAPSQEVRAAFDLRRLILGETMQARELVGRNITGGGKLTVEAIALAAKDGLYESEIRAAHTSCFPAAREAAAWALETYF